MYKRSIVIALVVLTVTCVYIKSIVDLQNDKRQIQEELLQNEGLLLTAKDEIKATQDLLNNQIQKNETLIAEIDSLQLELETLKKEHETLKKEYEILKKEHEECKKLIDFVDLDAPTNQRMKSYMDYRAITAKTSRQYILQHTLAYTGDYGLRMVNGRYCVALGSYYTKTIGQYVDIELENGKIIHGILADQKSDAHTDAMNQIHSDGSVVEFVVDGTVFDPAVIKHTGDISYLNGWDSKVVKIRVYDTIEDF